MLLTLVFSLASSFSRTSCRWRLVQANAPSKDYYHLLVTGEGVVWRRWLITPKAVTNHVRASPEEQYCTLEDFIEHEAFKSEITGYLGQDVYNDAAFAVRKKLDAKHTTH